MLLFTHLARVPAITLNLNVYVLLLVSRMTPVITI